MKKRNWKIAELEILEFGNPIPKFLNPSIRNSPSHNVAFAGSAPDCRPLAGTRKLSQLNHQAKRLIDHFI